MQSVLRDRKLPLERVPQREYFKFGPGDPILSVTGWKYPVGVNGMMSSFFISEIDAEQPVLVGPDELAEWKAAVDFEDGTLRASGTQSWLIPSNTGHPCFSLLAFPEPSGAFMAAGASQQSD